MDREEVLENFFMVKTSASVSKLRQVGSKLIKKPVFKTLGAKEKNVIRDLSSIPGTNFRPQSLQDASYPNIWHRAKGKAPGTLDSYKDQVRQRLKQDHKHIKEIANKHNVPIRDVQDIYTMYMGRRTPSNSTIVVPNLDQYTKRMKAMYPNANIDEDVAGAMHNRLIQHELAETAALSKNVRRFSGHLGTTPILRDLNMAVTASGPGAELLKKDVFRNRQEEATRLLRILKKGNSSSAADVEGLLAGNRISRHKIKRIEKEYSRLTDSMFDRAKKPVPTDIRNTILGGSINPNQADEAKFSKFLDQIR